MRGKAITYYDTNGKELFRQRATAIKTEPNRSIILRTFATHPEAAYLETNVRRYTAGDIYANHKGQAI